MYGMYGYGYGYGPWIPTIILVLIGVAFLSGSGRVKFHVLEIFRVRSMTGMTGQRRRDAF